MQELLSLREIGRRLSIPPSSVAYYKDRFAPYIPTAGGKGRRIRYSAEALIVFKEIREMFEQNLSADQVEQHLSSVRRVATTATVEGLSRAAFQSAESGAGQQEAHERSVLFVQDVAGVLDKMGAVLEAQAGFRDEIAALRDEVHQLHQEKQELAESYEVRLRQLDDELARFKRERAELVGMFLDEYYTSAGKEIRPEGEMLERPLVVHSAGEFLGVMGGKKPFSLRNLVGLMERSVGNKRVHSMRWAQQGAMWVLSVETGNKAVKDCRSYKLTVLPKVTPSGNAVTELAAMSVDGEEVPHNFVLMLFKSVKEDLEK